MKKYFLGLAALVCALAFSAFTKPFANYEFKLLTDPVAANIVNNDAQWKTSGAFFGECVTAQNDIACKILLKTTRGTYFHTDNGEQVLNTRQYAIDNAQDYLEITEAVVNATPDRVISSIQPMQFVSGTTFTSVSLGADLSSSNAKE